MFAIRALQCASDGRLGLADVVLTAVSLLVLCVTIAASLDAGHDIQGGLTYILGTLGSLVGTALFAAGSWRVGLLPRWLLVVWPIVWIIGSFAAASPLLPAALYVVLMVSLRTRCTAASNAHVIE